MRPRVKHHFKESSSKRCMVAYLTRSMGHPSVQESREDKAGYDTQRNHTEAVFGVEL